MCLYSIYICYTTGRIAPFVTALQLFSRLHARCTSWRRSCLYSGFNKPCVRPTCFNSVISFSWCDDNFCRYLKSNSNLTKTLPCEQPSSFYQSSFPRSFLLRCWTVNHQCPSCRSFSSFCFCCGCTIAYNCLGSVHVLPEHFPLPSASTPASPHNFSIATYPFTRT